MSWSQGNFAGRLGADPETREASGKQICKFRVAADTGYGDNKKPLWVTCVAFGRDAENIPRFFTKGSFIIVSGELRPNEWEGKDGTKNKSFELVIRNWAFGNKAPGDNGDTYRPSGDTGTRKAAEKQAPAESEDDLPF